MRMKNIIIVGLLPVLGALTACSVDDEQTADRVPISLSASTLTVEETRTAADTALNRGFIEVGQAVRVRVRNTGGADDDWTDYTYTAAANGVLTAPATPPFYPIDNTNVDIVAYSPSLATSTFTVRSDQTTDDGYLASDLIFASKSNQAKTTAAVPLQFEHKMAKVRVTVTAGSGVSTISDVTLNNVYPTVSFNESTGVVSSAEGTKTNIKLVKDNEAATAVGAAAFPAQTIEETLLTVVTNLGTATYAVDSKTFTAGNVYVMNIRVKQTDINTTTTITEWVDNSTVNIGGGVGSPFMTFTVGGVRFRMVFVEGTDDDIALNFDDQTTNASYNRHPVTLKGISDYYIGQTEVTNALWYAVMGSKPALANPVTSNNGQPNVGNNYPVVYMSYNDVCTASTGFIDKLNAAAADQLPAGMQFNLSSEVQWQYAAIGGKYSNGYTYAGSSIWGDSAWEKDNGPNTTHPVATKPANELGIYDMSGNVWELCRDPYAAATNNQVLPKDYVATSGSGCAIRGGSWCDAEANKAYLYPSFRYIWNATNKNHNVGLRVVLQNK